MWLTMRFSRSRHNLFSSYSSNSNSVWLSSPFLDLMNSLPKSYTFSGTQSIAQGMNALLQVQKWKCDWPAGVSSLVLTVLLTLVRNLTPSSSNANSANLLYSSVVLSSFSSLLESCLQFSYQTFPQLKLKSLLFMAASWLVSCLSRSLNSWMVSSLASRRVSSFLILSSLWLLDTLRRDNQQSFWVMAFRRDQVWTRFWPSGLVRMTNSGAALYCQLLMGSEYIFSGLVTTSITSSGLLLGFLTVFFMFCSDTITLLFLSYGLTLEASVLVCVAVSFLTSELPLATFLLGSLSSCHTCFSFATSSQQSSSWGSAFITNFQKYYEQFQNLRVFQERMSHQELQIAPGVYITDFRKDGKLVGIETAKSELTNDIGLLLDQCRTIESKCKMLEYSIQELKGEQNWQEDEDYKQAVEQNWTVIVRLCGEMMEKILRLHELKYVPDGSKMEELLNVERVDAREARARKELEEINKAGIYL